LWISIIIHGEFLPIILFHQGYNKLCYPLVK
jgi:hypothetical protein